MENKDVRYIAGILKRDKNIIEEIYARYRPSIFKYILTNSGNEEDADDVFQDAIEIVLRQARKKKFELTSSFHTYLYGISVKLWLGKLRKKRNSPLRNGDVMQYSNVDSGFDLDESILLMERRKLFKIKFDELSKKCRDIIKLYNEKISMKKIAEQLGYKNDNVAMQTSFQCRERLKKMIKADPAYNELKAK